MPPTLFANLPYDILPPILEQLVDRKDWYNCALVSLAFNRAATPLLYRKLDSRISKGVLFHPSTTLLARPALAQYVRHITETGTVHGILLPRYPTITSDSLAAIRLCTKLSSVTWVDDTSTHPTTLLAFLDILCTLPLRSLTVRTHKDMGEEVWAKLTRITGLRRISIWSMEGPPRVLQGWPQSTLTHLELGRCAGVPPTVLITVLSQLPLLRELRLKGAPAAAIPAILACLPHLVTLDTEYLGAGVYRPPAHALPALRSLTVRTSSMDTLGPQRLWAWIAQLLPAPSLAAFQLSAFSATGHTGVPRAFLLALADRAPGLRAFRVGTAQLTLADIACLCDRFPALEELVCAVASPNPAAIMDTVHGARNLTSLRLHVEWLPRASGTECPFTQEHATDLMLRYPESQLRAVGIGPVLYTGKWVLGPAGVKFHVTRHVDQDKWYS